MNVKDTIAFDGKTFTDKMHPENRNPTDETVDLVRNTLDRL